MQTLRIRVRQESLLAHLAAKPAILHAREESSVVGPLKLVDPYAAGLQTAGDALGLREVF